MSRKRTLQEVYDFFKEQGYELLSTEYKNAHQKLQYKCPEGHIHEITWNNFQRGRRCPDCANDKLRQERRYDEKKVIEAFEKKISTKFYHPLAGKDLTYEDAINFQARYYRRVIEGEVGEYVPLLLR